MDSRYLSMETDIAPIAIIPAAGRGSRLAPFPCPKELYPIGFQTLHFAEGDQRRPKVIGQYVVEQVRSAGAHQALMIVGENKYDLLRYFGNGSRFDMEIGYLYQETLRGMPQAIDLAYPWVRDRQLIIGMPDTIVLPKDAFQIAYHDHLQARSDLTLGLLPTQTPSKFGMVDWDASSRNVLETIDKPSHSTLSWLWGFACWGPAFTELLHQFVGPDSPPSVEQPSVSESLLGDAFNRAIAEGLSVKAVPFPQGQYMDIGTADELDATLQRFRLHDES